MLLRSITAFRALSAFPCAEHRGLCGPHVLRHGNLAGLEAALEVGRPGGILLLVTDGATIKMPKLRRSITEMGQTTGHQDAKLEEICGFEELDGSQA